MLEMHPIQILRGFPEIAVPVSKVEDFPRAVSGVISLEEGKTYILMSWVDLKGARLQSDVLCTLCGFSPETSGLKSTGLDASTALLTGRDTLTLSRIGIDHGRALDLDGVSNPVASLDWDRVNFLNATEGVGTVKDYNNFIADVLGFLNAGGLEFRGTFGTIGIDNTIYNPADSEGQTALLFPADLTILRRVRIQNSSFIILPGETGINFSESCTVPDQGYILDNLNFAGGGSYCVGVQSNDNKALWRQCVGVKNSGSFGHLYMRNNVTPTVISTSGVYVKAAGTTLAGESSDRFDVSSENNRAIYKGSVTSYYEVQAIVSFTSGQNNVIGFRIAKNGVTIASTEQPATANGARNENIVLVGMIELSKDDHVELWLTNETSTQDVTVTDYALTCKRIPA